MLVPLLRYSVDCGCIHFLLHDYVIVFMLLQDVFMLLQIVLQKHSIVIIFNFFVYLTNVILSFPAYISMTLTVYVWSILTSICWIRPDNHIMSYKLSFSFFIFLFLTCSDMEGSSHCMIDCNNFGQRSFNAYEELCCSLKVMVAMVM